MTSRNLMAGIAAFVAALVVVAVVVAVFSRGEPKRGVNVPAQDKTKTKAAGEQGKPLVDIMWKGGEGTTGKTRKQPAAGKTDEVGKTPDADTGQGTD